MHCTLHLRSAVSVFQRGVRIRKDYQAFLLSLKLLHPPIAHPANIGKVSICHTEWRKTMWEGTGWCHNHRVRWWGDVGGGGGQIKWQHKTRDAVLYLFYVYHYTCLNEFCPLTLWVRQTWPKLLPASTNLPDAYKEYLLYKITHTVMYSYGCNHKLSNKQNRSSTIIWFFSSCFPNQILNRSQLASSAAVIKKFAPSLWTTVLFITFLDYCSQQRE